MLRSRDEKEFLKEMEKMHLSHEGTGRVIRSSLNAILGESAATAAISYTGDGSDDLKAFAQRAKELFGDGASSIFEKIVASQPGADARGKAEASRHA